MAPAEHSNRQMYVDEYSRQASMKQKSDASNGVEASTKMNLGAEFYDLKHNAIVQRMLHHRMQLVSFRPVSRLPVVMTALSALIACNFDGRSDCNQLNRNSDSRFNQSEPIFNEQRRDVNVRKETNCRSKKSTCNRR